MSSPSNASSINTRNPAIRRIMADVRELERHPSSRYHAVPLEDNFFEWHFTIRGPSGSDFEGGIYHGRILLPPEYPFKPPNIVFLTRNGRFEVGTKICLSISAHHEESWQPAWGVRTMLEAIISFLPSEGAGAIGALEWSKEERQKCANESRCYNCPTCGLIADLLQDPSLDLSTEDSSASQEIADQISQLRMSHTRSSSVGDGCNVEGEPSASHSVPGSTVPVAGGPEALTQDLQINTITAMEARSSPELQTLAAAQNPPSSPSSSVDILRAAIANYDAARAILDEREAARVLHQQTSPGRANIAPSTPTASSGTASEDAARPTETPPSLKVVRRRVLIERANTMGAGSTVESENATGHGVELVQETGAAARREQHVAEQEEMLLADIGKADAIDRVLQVILSIIALLLVLLLSKKCMRYLFDTAGHSSPEL